LEPHREFEDLCLLGGAQVVVPEEVTHGPPRCARVGHQAFSFPEAALSRIAGRAATNAPACSSLRTSGGASRTTSGWVAPTRSPASRAAASTALPAGAVSPLPSRRPPP